MLPTITLVSTYIVIASSASAPVGEGTGRGLVEQRASWRLGLSCHFHAAFPRRRRL